MTVPVPGRVGRYAGPLPAYLIDLAHLRTHVRAIRAALPDRVELWYAAKANPDQPVLRALAGLVDGVEVASGGELRHVRAALPDARLSFGGPGKTAAELAIGLAAGVDRFHVESTHELRLLAVAAERLGRRADVLLRANLAVSMTGAVLAMGGRPSPFGLDPAGLAACREIVRTAPILRLRGLHTHLASGLDAAGQLALAEQVLAWAAEVGGWAIAEVNLGGGMAVDYRLPGERFDWPAYGAGLARLAARHPDTVLRIEPGRSVTAYSGWYLTRVLDVKRSHGAVFAVLAGGTHQLRTPAAKGHDQPFAVLPTDDWPWPWERPAATGEPVTLVGQLCTPKDVLARSVPVERIRAHDVVAFALAGAYAWNISHQNFLMHPPPAFAYLY
ncbi:MAG TPA: type III PLP-dependent enzyme [Mycobacteriales bacterium]|nr:type III PLP-dependent enzyme [Mycobacteriales bacterium]